VDSGRPARFVTTTPGRGHLGGISSQGDSLSSHLAYKAYEHRYQLIEAEFPAQLHERVPGPCPGLSTHPRWRVWTDGNNMAGNNAKAPVDGAGQNDSTEIEHPTEPPLPPFLTIDELAELLRLAPKTIAEAHRRGDIPGGRSIGRRVRFSRDVILRWFDGKNDPRKRRKK